MQKSKTIEEKSVPRIVLDTNVFISGILNPHGLPGKILNLLTEPGSFNLLISEEIFLEYSEVIQRRKFGLSKAKVSHALKVIFKHAFVLSPKQKLNITPDPDDNKFLECAVEGMASFIVTGNKKHYPFSEFQGVKIVSPEEFLSFLGF